MFLYLWLVKKTSSSIKSSQKLVSSRITSAIIALKSGSSFAHAQKAEPIECRAHSLVQSRATPFSFQLVLAFMPFSCLSPLLGSLVDSGLSQILVIKYLSLRFGYL